MISWQTSWLDDRETVLMVSSGTLWDWSDFHDSIVRVQAIIRRKPHTVDVILDLRHARPPDCNIVAHLRRAYANIPANNGVNVIVGAGGFVEAVLSVMSRVVAKYQLDYASTIEDAVEIITDRRAARV